MLPDKKKTERTSFTKDIEGRYLCNDLIEANAWKSSPGGRPFDFIVVGGGTFGSAIAEHIWFRQKKTGGGLRTLVIEAGLFTVPEHVQNTGIQGFTDPGNPFFLNENAPQPEPQQNEVWGIPWKSTTAFKGLAYAVGGRSVYWGGWSPRLLADEMATWPTDTVADLNRVYFDESTRQIGVDDTNDFIFGELHNALRRRLFDNIRGSAIALNDLPRSPLLKPGADPEKLLGLSSTAGLSPDDLKNMLKLEAPLAVQARPPHAGFFPLNKFSTVPLLMKAARTAFTDSNGDDARKEFMLLADTHVKSIQVTQTGSGTWRATGVDTHSGLIELAPGGSVMIALGTIESARLALLTFDATSIPTKSRMGKNLIGHLRSNLVIRVPRTSIPGIAATTNELQTSALFLKCRANKSGSVLGHFHLQISATGGGNTVGAEDELFRKIPDVEFFDQLRSSTDTHVAIAIRGIGQMEAADFNNLAAHPSRVDLDHLTDEYIVRRASVTITTTQRDKDLWDIMDATMTDVASIFANGSPLQTVQPLTRDGLGTTHHETGTLWMGTDPGKSVTDGGGRFHHTENLYAAGPCLFPSIGSANPMLTGIAMARRTGDRIITPPAFVADSQFEALFDGNSFGNWKMSTIRNQPGRNSPGNFLIRRGAFESHPGTDLGMLWLDRPTPPRFVLRLQWMMTAPDDNSGVFVGFPHPDGQGYDNTAYVGVNFGFEIQIDELARPDNALIHRTAAIYSFKGPTDGPLRVRPEGEWNEYEITVHSPNFTVALNGHVVDNFNFTGDPQSPNRGLPSTPAQPRFIGLQIHTGTVLFRNIQWKAL